MADDDSYRTLSQTLDDTRSQESKHSSGRSTKSALSAAGASLRSFSQDEGDRAAADSYNIRPVAYKRGGKVRKSKRKDRSVLIRAHEGERVIPASKRKKVERLMKRSGMSLTNKKRKGRKVSGR